MSWIIIISGILNLFLGLIVWLTSTKNHLNRLFFSFSVCTFLSIGFDYLFRFYPSLIILKSSYAFATLVPLSALPWILIVSGYNVKNISKSIKNILYVLAAIFFFLPYSDGLIIKNISELTTLGYRGQLGPVFILYAAYIAMYVASFIYILIKAHIKFQGEKRAQILVILIGVSLYGGLALTFSLILPQYFDIFTYTLLDAPSLIFFVGFTAYSILKFHFLKIKIIATETLVFSLGIFIFIRLLLSTSKSEIIINILQFLITIIFGVLLVKSVMLEVSQREHIQKLNVQLESTNKRLQALDKQKSEFISFATHQLRAPLTAMKGYSSLILDGDMGKIDAEARKGISRIYESTETLTGIVDDYLNITRIELGTMKYAFETIDLKTLINDVIAELKPTIDKTKVECEVIIDDSKIGYRMTADKDKLKQVFINLIDNAFKYTPRGKVTIHLSRDENEHKLVFKVSDNGIGISEETMPKLFDKFTRANNANKTNIKGTGLGLFVAREIARAHNGEIHAYSKGEGKGAEFTVTLDPFNKI